MNGVKKQRWPRGAQRADRGEAQPLLQFRQVPGRWVLSTSSDSTLELTGQKSRRPDLFKASYSGAGPDLGGPPRQRRRARRPRQGGLGLMDPNKVTGARVAAPGAICRTGVKPMLSFKLIEGIWSPSRASSALGETRGWLCGLVLPGAAPVCSGWHRWLTLGRASRM